MNVGLSESRQATLRALTNTYFPSIEVKEDPTGYWSRAASDLGVDHVIAGSLGELPPPLRDGLLGLLDVLEAQGFANASQSQREQILSAVAKASPEAAQGITFFEKQTLLNTYGLPARPSPNPNVVTYGAPKEENSPDGPFRGRNPNWEVVGYPGPISTPPNKPKSIQTVTPSGPEMVLDADVCIIGSGAGGGVIAARMAERGRRVVVLEMGGHFNASDFHQLELWAFKNLWYRGGVTPTANGTVNMLAGSTLGGGTEVNWMNCIPTPALIREDWEKTYGLDGLTGPQFQEYVDRVMQRLSANQGTSLFNDANLRMRQGCQRLDYLTKQTYTNWAPEKFNPLQAGYTGIGDQSGGKQTVRRTFLLDAYQQGAKIIVHCKAEQVLVENGRAVGVKALYSDRQGRQSQVLINASQVVVAGGALESPALLQRSGIGGPAVGKYLRLQPGGAVYGIYKDKQRSWWGTPMSANCEQFVDTGDGHGFYMEIPAFAPGFYASVIPWSSGKQHKEVMSKVPNISTFIWFLRDKGHGVVGIDSHGNAVPTYQLDDPVDDKNFRHAIAEACRIHQAAGAEEILFGLSNRIIAWKHGENLDDFIAKVTQEPIIDGAQPVISAHQLCTCRMGRDPNTSVADPNGQLFDTQGVWIGDGSACPTSLGANPMVTIMALAERTADRLTQQTGGNWNRSQTPWPQSFCPVPVLDAVPQLAMGMLNMATQFMAPFDLINQRSRNGNLPTCGCGGTLVADANQLRCSACGYSVTNPSHP